jgi:CheY-like chemotaxis protein/HPt (histidine-containing phosphotransfer) domain-containing protein
MDNPASTLPAVAPEISAVLAGCRVALVGFDPAETARIAGILRRVGSLSTPFEENWLSGTGQLGDALLLKLASVKPPALRAAAASNTPVLAVAPAASVLEGLRGAYRWPHDLLPDPWSECELLIRLFRLVAPARTVTPRAPLRPQPLILIADDDPSWIALLESTLRMHGLASRTSPDGVTTLHLVRQLQPDLLVLDVKMPRMNGFEVLATIRRDPQLEDLPVALLTGCDEAEDVTQASDLRANDYVVKTASPTVLLNRIKRLLAASPALRTLPLPPEDSAPPPAGSAPLDDQPRTEASGPGDPPLLDPKTIGPVMRSWQGLPPSTASAEQEMVALRASYLENRVAELVALASAVGRADFATLAQAGHNLKGTGTAYGFAELTELGQQLEAAAKSSNASEVRALLDKTEAYLNQARASGDSR